MKASTSCLTIAAAFALLFCFLGCGGYREAAEPAVPGGVQLDVVYPRPAEGDTIFVVPRVDSTFALGSVRPANAQVFVNGVEAEVWGNGAFLAYFPLEKVGTVFHFAAVSPQGEWTRMEIPFQYPVYEKIEWKDSLNLAINQRLPARLTISEDHVVMRTEPGLAYWLFPPKGAVAYADSFDYPYYRVPLCSDLSAWVEDRFVQFDTTKQNRPSAVLHTLTVTREGGWTKISVPLQESILFHLEDETGSGPLVLDLFGAVSRMDRIYYDPQDSLVRDIRWRQVRDDLLRLTIYLDSPRLWGYEAYYEEGALAIRIRQQPEIGRRVLERRVIALDAGHGGEQPGAIGPTRLAEKEPNLNLALRLGELLEKEGARVILTRRADSTLGIYERAGEALAQGAEVLLSLHNNALSDGKNPFILHGSSVHYYHPQSRDLARILHRHLVQATGLRDHGFYYQNLALARPTGMLAVLLECAFMIHPEEEVLLRDERFIDRVAGELVKGLEDFYKREKKSKELYYDTYWNYPPRVIRNPIWHPLTSQRKYE